MLGAKAALAAQVGRRRRANLHAVILKADPYLGQTIALPREQRCGSTSSIFGRDAAPSGSHASGAKTPLLDAKAALAAQVGRRRRAFPTTGKRSRCRASSGAAAPSSIFGRDAAPPGSQTSGTQRRCWLQSQKNCPPRAVPEQFPFPNDRVDDRVTGNQTSNEGLSSCRAPSLRDFIQHRSGTSLRLIANTEGQICCGRSREILFLFLERSILGNPRSDCLAGPL